MVDVVYTIGYSGFKLDEFIEKIKEYKIDVIIDVRSSPYSQYFKEYNKENICKVLNELEGKKIYYRNYSLEFGARQLDLEGNYYPKGYLDFEKFSQSENFLSGVKKLEDSMKQNYTVVLMCAEKDPFTCHRTILVARAFFKRGYKIIHLMPDGKNVTQEDIEKQLLDKYAKNRRQMGLFNPIVISEEEHINEAYRKHNEKIGYSIEKEEDE